MDKMPDSNEKKVGAVGSANLKVESTFYALVGTLISLPILAVFSLGTAIGWFCEKVFPLIGEVIFKGSSYILSGVWNILIAVCKKVVSSTKRFLNWINWYIVRSLTRMFSIITFVVSWYFIGSGVLTYSFQKIFTGEYYDPNPPIVFIHAAIVTMLVSTLIYYSAWAWSKSEETAIVQKYTTKYMPSLETMKKMWKGSDQ